MPDSRRFLFGPRDRRGLVAGVRTGQVVVVVAALVAAIVALNDLRGLERGLTAVLVAAGCVVAFFPVGGRTLEEWLPVAARYSSAGARGARRAVPGVPEGGRRPPSVLSAFSVLTLDAGTRLPIGALHDRRRGSLAAVIATSGGAFALRDRDERTRLVEAWASVLAATANAGTPHRLQWLVRTVPDEAAALRARLSTGFAAASGPRHLAQTSYREFLAKERDQALRHEILLAVAIPAATSPGRAAQSAAGLARTATSYARRLADAGIAVDGLVSPAGLRALLRSGFAESPVRGEVSWPWPVALEERWSALRTDGLWHATYWIAEWPRHEVDSDFLLPVLLNSTDRRVVSVVMSPLAPAKALREVERARTSSVADSDLRRRHGFALTARAHRAQQAVLRREDELAEGHGAYRFSGYVTVSAATPEELEEAGRRIEQAAAVARLELRRLYGSQAEALCCTLPVGRGCG